MIPQKLLNILLKTKSPSNYFCLHNDLKKKISYKIIMRIYVNKIYSSTFRTI